MRDKLHMVKIGDGRYELYRNLSLAKKISYNIKSWYSRRQNLEMVVLTGFVLAATGGCIKEYYNTQNPQNKNKTEQAAQCDSTKQSQAINTHSSIDDIADAGLRKRTEEWLGYYTTDVWGKKVIQMGLDNNAIYVGLVESYVESKNLPEEYVDWIRAQEILESVSRSDAKSPSDARGPHQIMKKTGKELGLKSNKIINEAGDPIKGTQKGIDYLMELVNRFGITYGFVAYNAGRGNVYEAITTTNSHDYNTVTGYIKMQLEKKKAALEAKAKKVGKKYKGYINPDEPVNYLPKIAAIREILKDPAKYGFVEPEAKDFREVYMVINAGESTFSKIAKNYQMSKKELRKINGHINDISHITPKTQVYVPRPTYLACNSIK